MSAAAAKKLLALAAVAGAGYALYRWWNPAGTVDIQGLDNSPLLDTFFNAPVSGMPTINILDPNSLLQAAGINPYAGSASAGGSTMVSKKWVTPAAGAKYELYFKNASIKYGLPDGLLSRMAYQESKFRPDIIDGRVRSPAGATGIMQLMPVHFAQVNPLDPQAAINYAGRMMAGFKKQFGAWDKALAAYNWGPGHMKERLAAKGENWLQGMNKETFNYVNQIASDVGIYPAGIMGNVGGYA